MIMTPYHVTQLRKFLMKVCFFCGQHYYLQHQLTSPLNSNLLEVNDDVNLDIATDDPEVEDGCPLTTKMRKPMKLYQQEPLTMTPVRLLFTKARMITNGKQGLRSGLVKLPLAKELYMCLNHEGLQSAWNIR